MSYCDSNNQRRHQPINDPRIPPHARPSTSQVDFTNTILEHAQDYRLQGGNENEILGYQQKQHQFWPCSENSPGYLQLALPKTDDLKRPLVVGCIFYTYWLVGLGKTFHPRLNVFSPENKNGKTFNWSNHKASSECSFSKQVSTFHPVGFFQGVSCKFTVTNSVRGETVVSRFGIAKNKNKSGHPRLSLVLGRFGVRVMVKVEGWVGSSPVPCSRLGVIPGFLARKQRTVRQRRKTLPLLVSGTMRRSIKVNIVMCLKTSLQRNSGPREGLGGKVTSRRGAMYLFYCKLLFHVLPRVKKAYLELLDQPDINTSIPHKHPEKKQLKNKGHLTENLQ